MATAEVSTAKAWPGMTFRLRVNRPVEVDGRVLIPVGTPAFGEVVEARDAGGLGKSGRLTAKLTHLTLAAQDIRLDGETSSRGRGAGHPGVAVVFTGLVGLFHRGNNAKIKAGELLAGFIAEDVLLDVSGPDPRRIEVAPGQAEAPR